jgi:hypothetical protein
MPKGQPVGDVNQAIVHVIAKIRELEADEATRLDPEWVAMHGPRFKRVEDALIAYKRYFYPIDEYLKRPKGMNDYQYLSASEAFLELSAACLKIAVDFEAAYSRRAIEALEASGMLVGAGIDDDD